jgi:NAD(P)-dependent dehydrogenase (short-subunit alcohol dehydrogenase family)
MKDSILKRARDGAAIIISSHLLHLVEEICSHILILKKGRKVIDGTMAEIRRQFSQQSGDTNLETALPHQYDELAAMIEREFGKLDGLLHNASIVGPRTPLEQLSGDNFMRVMQVNVNATFMLTSTLLPLLKLSSDASVVFTSSSVGRKGRAYWGAYAVSKFATEGLMQVLADEVDGVAPVRANSINPGATRTDMRAQVYPGENPANNPLPEAIMPVYLYLMGPDSSGVNGQAFDAQ